MKPKKVSNVGQIREYIRDCLHYHQVSAFHVEKLAGVPERVLRKMLKDDNCCCSVSNLIDILEAIGIEMILQELPDFDLPPPKPRGRPSNKEPYEH